MVEDDSADREEDSVLIAAAMIPARISPARPAGIPSTTNIGNSSSELARPSRSMEVPSK